jgi:hypothetical protein
MVNSILNDEMVMRRGAKMRRLLVQRKALVRGCLAILAFIPANTEKLSREVQQIILNEVEARCVQKRYPRPK